MEILVSAFVGIIIILMVTLAIRIIRINGESAIFQFASLAALTTAILGFLELQFLQIRNYEVLAAIESVYSLMILIIVFSALSSAIAFVNPLGRRLYYKLTKYQYLVCAIIPIYLGYQIDFNQVSLAKNIILSNGLWLFSFDQSTVTAKIYALYLIIGVLVVAYCFWIKLSSIKKKPGMLNKKIIMLVMTIVPMVSIFYFLSYSSNHQVPYLASLPISICVATLCWTYADFNIFQINSKVARKEILESMANSMVITDLKYNIVEINAEAKKLICREEDNLIGKDMLSLVRKGKIKNWKALAKAILKHPFNKHTGEFSIEKKANSRHYHLSVNPVYNKNKHKTGFLFLALDLTQEKQKEKAILARTKELQKSNLELERFAYIASHDLKTPLRNVVSFLDLIERKVVKYNDKELKEFTYHARQGASQMYHLIQDVLEYSELNNESKSSKSVNLNETMLKICMNLQTEMSAKNAKILVSDMPIILGESIHMTQLFGNLIENGLKYNDTPAPCININHRCENGQHIFAVADNGIGIDEKYYSQIFQMFKRLHTSSSYEGTGIGLSICKKIIDLYQGEIWLESKPSEGSVFFFTLSSN